MKAAPISSSECGPCPRTGVLFQLEARAPRGDPDTGDASDEHWSTAYWKSCQLCTHVLNSVVKRDPWTGSALAQELQDVLTALSAVVSKGDPLWPEDALEVMAAHCLPGLESILRRPRRRLFRQHQLRGLHQIREIDTTSMAWLARQPGRSVPEKIGSRQRALAVVRSTDLNTLENRVVRRVANDLARLLELRLEGRASDEVREHEHERTQLLRRALLLARDGIADQGFCALPLVDVAQPNNALLSDADYHRIWRTWLWLGEYRSSLERSWDGGLQRIVTTAFWVLASAIATQRDADVLNEDCIPAAGIGREEFQIERIQADEDAAIDLWIDHPSPNEAHEQTLFRMRRSGSTIHVSYYRARGSGWIPLSGDAKAAGSHFDLTFTLDHQAPLVAGRGYPISIVLLSDDTNQTLASYADMGEFLDLSRSIATAVIGESDDQTRPASRENSWPTAARQIGVDCSGSALRVSSEYGDWIPKNLGSMRPREPGEVGPSWRFAARDRTFPIAWHGREWLSVATILACPAASIDQASTQDAALHNLFPNLWREMPRSRDAELAIAVPSGLPHFVEHRLRTAAGRGFGRTWTVERNVAVALGWQTSDDYPAAQVNDGDCVLVLDGEAQALGFSLLRARREGDGDDTIQPISWERDLADPPWPQEAGLRYREWMKNYLLTSAEVMSKNGMLSHAQLTALIDHLIEQGEAERLLEDGHTVRVSQPEDRNWKHGFLSLHYSPATAKQTCDWWMGGYREWLRQVSRTLARRIQAVDGEERAGGRNPRWHVIYAGRPFNLRSIRDRVERAWQTVLEPELKGIGFLHHAPDEAHLLAARGAASFLQRHSAALSTWRDVLPNLYLEVEGEQGPETRQILERAVKRPGESVNLLIGQTLTLPPHQHEYVLPVITGDEGGAIAYNAHLRLPGLTLARPLLVNMEVLYKYGEDNYRLFISPAPDEPKVFERIEMEWAPLVNAVPEFSSPVRNQRIGQKLDRAEERLRALLPGLQGVNGQLEQAIEFIRTVRRAFRVPSSGPADGMLLAHLQQPPFSWESLFSDLVRHWQTERDQVAADPSHSSVLREALEEAIPALAELTAAIEVSAPEGVADAISGTLGYTGRDDRDVTGAALRVAEACVTNAGVPAQQKVLAAVIRQLSYRFKRVPLRGATPELKRLNRPLGAAAVILRADRNFAATLRVSDFKMAFNVSVRTLDAIALTLSHLAGNGDSQTTLSDREYLRSILFTFRNACELLIGLLCVRDADGTRPEIRDMVRAGAERARRLAKLIARIDRSFPPPLTLSRIPQRVILESDQQARSGMSPLVQALYSYLAGYNPLRLVQVEETSE